MATPCEDVSARMMELLYGELSADERASIEAHVAGCTRCRSELDGFEKTRAAARQALDEAPPARVRAAIVKAAAEHLAAQAQPAARRPAAPDKTSFWDRVRAAWAFPTLATVGALAVFVVAKGVFVNPERALQHPARVTAEAPSTPPAPPELARQAPSGNERFDETAQRGARFEQEKNVISPPANLPVGGDQKQRPPGGRADYKAGLAKDDVGEGAMHAAPEPSAAAPRKKSIGVDRANDFVPKRPGKPQLDVDPMEPAPLVPAPESAKPFRDQPRASSGMQFAPPPPPREAPAHAKGGKAADKVAAKKEAFEDDLLAGGETASSGSRTAAAKPPAPPTGSLDEMLDAKPGKARAGGGAAGLAGPRNKADGYGSGAAQASSAPAMRNEAAKRPVPAPAAAPAPAMAAAPAPASPPPPPASRVRAAKTSADDAAEEMEAAPVQAKKEKKSASGRAGAMETLAQRADRLFAERRWTEAAEAYRDLLRRDPHNDDAERWRRQRQIAAENADVSGNASFAEKRAAEAKSPRKPADAKASKRSADSDAASSAPAATEQQR